MALRELNRHYYRMTNKSPFNDRGINVFTQDWDNLIILDACRYDMMNNTDIEGDVDYIYSKASMTVEFLKANFNNRDLSDTVYITANPMLYQHRDEINTNFHAIHNVWLDEGWNEEHGTVLPEAMACQTINIASKYENKRIISHFIQPHYPFIDSNTEFDKGQVDDPTNDVSFWRKKLMGELESISDDLIWEAYTENLDTALPHVEKLVSEIRGKTVVTADHGNMVGERSFPIPIKEYGHPASLYTEKLTKVPWVVFESSDRKEISGSEGQGKTDNQITGSVIEDRLKNLGYK